MTTLHVGPRLSPRDRVDILIAEYNALYGLATVRMGALDRRVPAAGAALLAFMGSVPLLPETTQYLFLVAIPVSLIWLLRTTINHARSFEDLLRRIELIEISLNRLADEELLGFQSSHPSRLRTVGGRTGAETVSAVFLAAIVLVAASAVVGLGALQASSIALGYVCFLSIVTIYLAWLLLGWSRYRYTAQPREDNGAARAAE